MLSSFFSKPGLYLGQIDRCAPKMESAQIGTFTNIFKNNEITGNLYVIKACKVLRKIRLLYGNESFYEQNSAQDS